MYRNTKIFTVMKNNKTTSNKSVITSVVNAINLWHRNCTITKDDGTDEVTKIYFVRITFADSFKGYNKDGEEIDVDYVDINYGTFVNRCANVNDDLAGVIAATQRNAKDGIKPDYFGNLKPFIIGSTVTIERIHRSAGEIIADGDKERTFTRACYETTLVDVTLVDAIAKAFEQARQAKLASLIAMSV